MDYTVLSVVRAPATVASALSLFKLALTKPGDFKSAHFAYDPGLQVTHVVVDAAQITAQITHDTDNASVSYPAVSRIHELGPAAFAIESYEGPHPDPSSWEHLTDYAGLLVVVANSDGTVDRIVSYTGSLVLASAGQRSDALRILTKIWRDTEAFDFANLRDSARLLK